MKLRTFITLLIIGASISMTMAQKANHFEAGLQGGFGPIFIVNQNNYGLREMDYELKYGAAFNLQLGYNFTENIGLFTEIGKQAMGQKYTDTWENFDVARDIDMSYLNIPLLFKYSYGESRARFRLLVGPQLAFLSKAEQTYTVNGMEIEGQFELENKDDETFDVGAKDITDRFNSMDIGVVLDLGADIFLMENILYLSAAARLNYGFTDINASAFQLNNIDGNYDPSHNAGGVFMIGIHYIIAGKAGE